MCSLEFGGGRGRVYSVCGMFTYLIILLARKPHHRMAIECECAWAGTLDLKVHESELDKMRGKLINLQCCWIIRLIHVFCIKHETQIEFWIDYIILWTRAEYSKKQLWTESWGRNENWNEGEMLHLWKKEIEKELTDGCMLPSWRNSHQNLISTSQMRSNYRMHNYC